MRQATRKSATTVIPVPTYPSIRYFSYQPGENGLGNLVFVPKGPGSAVSAKCNGSSCHFLSRSLPRLPQREPPNVFPIQFGIGCFGAPLRCVMNT
jgi:hypothetical protein